MTRLRFFLLWGLAISVTVAGGLSTAAAQTMGPSLDPSLPLSSYVIDTWQAEDGLPNDTVTALLQTRDGYLWLGTRGGLVRFDGMRFLVFDRTLVPEFLSNGVAVLKEGRDGSLWAGFEQGGLHRLRGDTWEHFNTQNGLSHNSVADLHETADGKLWIGTLLGVDHWDGEKLSSVKGCPENVVGIEETTDGSLWVLGRNQLLRIEGGACTPLPDPLRRQVHLGAGGGWSLLATRDGSLWLGTYSGSILRLTEDGQVTEVVRERTDGKGTRVMEMYEDRLQTIWAGTIDGLVRLTDGESTLFTAADGLADYRILSFFEDLEGSLWIGTYTGLNRLKKSRFDSLTTVDGLTDNITLAALEDSKGDIWIGSRSGVDRYAGGVLENIPTADGHRLESAWGLLEDSEGVLWVSTATGLYYVDSGVLRQYDRLGVPVKTSAGALAESSSGDLWLGMLNRAVRFDRAGATESLPLDGSVSAIYEDHQGDLWFGTEVALYRRRGTSLTRFPPKEDTRTYHIREIREDPAGVLWIGSIHRGLLRFEKGQFTEINTSNGLYDDHVWHSVEDAQGILWMCSDRGLFTAARHEIEELTRGERTSISSAFYGLDDGLPSLECNGLGNPAGIETADGRLWFMTAGGVLIVDPQNLEQNPVIPQVLVEEVVVDGVIADRNAPRGEALKIPVGARQLEIHFTATSLRDPSRVRFRYQLEGYDPDWAETSDRRWAVYGNLPPGRYRFRVTASNNDGLWNEQGASLRIVVPPPLWRTWWAFLLYALTLSAMVRAYVRAQKTKLANAHEVSRRLRDIDKLKDEFLANTSHELRTPLQGITGLAESLIDGSAGELPPKALIDLGMIESSGRRLSDLVNDLLDFSQLNHRSLALKPRSVDLHALVEVILAMSRPLLGNKNLQLENQVAPDFPPVEADEARLQQILYNLLGNAIKFTEEGLVTVSAEMLEGKTVIQVADTGIGMEEGQKEKIFEAFAQGEASAERAYPGTGLGLAVTRQLVHLHGGEIWVDSSPGQGAVFSFTIPSADPEKVYPPPTGSILPVIRREDLPAVAPSAVAAPAVFRESAPDAERAQESGAASDTATVSILIVDDEPVIRRVLSNYLAAANYDLREASSGAEALALLEERKPDLVLLDVMMPKMSGLEVCRRIRLLHEPSQLPVVFLTARNQTSDLVTGLFEGGNDYLVKPIAKGELLARIRTHLDLRHLYAEMEDLVQERMAQIKVLQGLLPICSQCKKVRDDDGYWKDFETYITHHSEASFSHGLCTDCAQELYPGMVS